MLLVLGCNDKSPVDSLDSAESESAEILDLDGELMPSVICADPEDTNCEDPPDFPDPPDPPDPPPGGGIAFDISSNLFPTGLEVVGIATASTSEPVDYISIEITLLHTWPNSNSVEKYNTDQAIVGVSAPFESGPWVLNGVATMEDGNVSDAGAIYISSVFN